MPLWPPPTMTTSRVSATLAGSLGVPTAGRFCAWWGGLGVPDAGRFCAWRGGLGVPDAGRVCAGRGGLGVPDGRPVCAGGGGAHVFEDFQGRPPARRGPNARPGAGGRTAHRKGFDPLVGRRVPP